MRSLILLFFYSLNLSLVFPLFFPFWRPLYFAPFLIICYKRRPLPFCLGWSLVCGIFIDLFSFYTPLGNYSLNYCLTTLCLYRYRLYLFEDRFSTLPLLTFFFASLSFFIQIGIFTITGKAFTLSWEAMGDNLIWMPLQDVLYAIFAFTLPHWGLVFLKRQIVIKRPRYS